MAQILAVVGAINSAGMLLKELKRSGCLKCKIVHTPALISSGGCSYSVSIEESCLPVLTKAALKSKIKIKGIYKEVLKEGESSYDSLS